MSSAGQRRSASQLEEVKAKIEKLGRNALVMQAQPSMVTAWQVIDLADVCAVFLVLVSARCSTAVGSFERGMSCHWSRLRDWSDAGMPCSTCSDRA